MRICFLVGSVDISGGTYVIFQHADYLQSAGHSVVLGTQEPFDEQTVAWHPSAKNLTLLPMREAAAQEFDIVIATWWKTALDLPRFKSSSYAYFVQSIETRFYPESEAPLRVLVESTYELPLNFVTEAVWIKEYLSSAYKQPAELVRNGIRKDLYHPDGAAIAPRFNDGRIRMLVEGPFGVRFKNTGRTIKVMKRARPDEIWLLTISELDWMPGVDRVFSRVPITDVPSIYRSCDVVVKLSYIEGVFMPPLEAFHCGGTAIVYGVTGHDEYIQHGVNALVAPPGDEDAAVRYLRNLKDQPAQLERLKRYALETANEWPAWDQSSNEFLRWVEGLIKDGRRTNTETLKKCVAEAWATYVRDERMRLGRRPWMRLRYGLHEMLDILPANTAMRIRQLGYLAERFS